MSLDGVEKRQFKRIFFPIKDEIVGIITIPDAPDESFKAKIMNISEGGACLVFNKDEMIRFNVDECLILSEITGSTSLSFIKNVDMQIRRVMDNQFFENIELGCEFQNVSEDIIEKIRALVDSEDLPMQ